MSPPTLPERFRVFAGNHVAIPAELLMEWIMPRVDEATVGFNGNGESWSRVVMGYQNFPFTNHATIERYLATNEGIRQELDSWAAWFKIHAPDPVPLMQRIGNTTQIIEIQGNPWDSGCWYFELCIFLAQRTAGLIHRDSLVHGWAFFDEGGNLLIAEKP